jgi:multiple sugar transport system ATP-binding protein
MAEVILKDVDKSYDGVTKVVDGFNLEIHDGEFIVLVGPSGCGKSTTLRMIAGLEDITRGTIRIGERVVNDVPPKDRDIAMVFQSYALYPHMTVYQNMAFALELRKTPKAEVEKKVKKAAGILGIENLLDRKPKALSGGQRQRVAVGRAIVRDPQCFLFDEPLSNLDAKLRVEMRAEIKDLHQRLESTTVYVTHDQEEAMTLGDRVVVMNGGIAQQVASAADVYHYPENRFVAGFLGGPPMNFLTGQLVSDGGELFFDEGSGRLPVPEWARQQLEASGERKLVMGVRPECISDERSARFPIGKNQLTMTVGQVQLLGDRMNVYLSTSEHQKIVAQVDGYSKLTTSETRPMYFDLDHVHFFSATEAGARLANPPRAKD